MTTNTVPTTTEQAPEPEAAPVPFFTRGDQIPYHPWGITPGSSWVERTEMTPGGSQTVWTAHCPQWCTGHNPDEQYQSRAELEADPEAWNSHYGPEESLWLGEISPRDADHGRREGFVSLDTEQVGRLVLARLSAHRRVPGGLSGAELTVPELRSLAAALLRVADRIEG